MKVTLIDNYDSFTYNIVYLLKSLKAKVTILPNDCTINDIEGAKSTHLIISPGPSSPKDSKICIEAIRYFAPRMPILGICLGHQCIAEAFNGSVVKMANPKHGKEEIITLGKAPLFNGLKRDLKIALYHSLCVNNAGDCEIIASDSGGIIMALKHRKFNCYGVQFHPESILQDNGKEIMKNFLSL